jgi:hypothetical protein
VKQHALATIGKGVAFVVGTSGLSAKDYAEIDSAAKAKGVGVFAAGNYSITATLLAKFAVMAAKYVSDVEVVDYASAGKPDVPSGTARELAERLSAARRPATSKPVSELTVPRKRAARRSARCRCIPCACRGSYFPAKPCSARPMSVCSSATTRAPRPSPMWRARFSRSGACATRSASGAASIS